MPSILNPSAGTLDEWALEQHVSPQEAQDGYLAAHEEERLVKSTVQPISNDVLDWVHKRYVEPSRPQLATQKASFSPSASMGRGAAVPSLLPGEAPDFAGTTLGHRPIAPPQTASAPDIRSLYRDEDEFASVISSVGHSKDPLSLTPFNVTPQLSGLNVPRPRVPARTSRPLRGEKNRAANVRQWDDITDRAARQYGVDANYIRAMMRAESSGDPYIVSPAGAVGVMQFIPSTAREYGLRVDDEVDERTIPEKAIPAAARYFADLLAMYDGNHDLAVAAYNAGPGAVDKYGGKIPPYAETQTHVKRVRSYYDNFRTGKY